mgnify:CR=1 FL=1
MEKVKNLNWFQKKIIAWFVEDDEQKRLMLTYNISLMNFRRFAEDLLLDVLTYRREGFVDVMLTKPEVDGKRDGVQIELPL